MAACKLDKSRHYGEIFGDCGGARFEQDGIVFDVNGEPLNAESPVESFANNASRSVIIEAPKKRGRPLKNDLEN